MFTSDNGPWISYGNHAGKTPYREAKGTGFDGGTRSACIMRYPKQSRPGQFRNATFCTMDLLPTFAELAGGRSAEESIDGRNVWDLIREGPERSIRTNITRSRQERNSRASSAAMVVGNCICRTSIERS